jgi:2-polyprenyl-3-methyl-5-hydroxy-6-metoxy-1,4-benzoquinol methylase
MCGFGGTPSAYGHEITNPARNESPMTTDNAGNQVPLRHLIGAYPNAPLRDRIHMAIRWLVCPLPTVAAYVPAQGTIADLGCGHGLFTQLLARQSGSRSVIGIDMDDGKIALAQGLRLPNLRFIAGDLAAFALPPVQAVTILDVLYLLPYAAQERLLAHCVERLAPGGKIILKEMAERPRWKAWLNGLEETLAVRVLRLTWSDGSRRFYFRTRAEWCALRGRLGLAVETIPLDHHYYHPHVLFIARKTRHAQVDR